MAQGGDIVEVTYNHPTVGSGTLFCKAGEDVTVKRGGYQSNDDDGMITGDGQRLDQINRVPWSIEFPSISWDMTDRDEQNALVDMAGSPVEGEWTCQSITGAIWSGRGKPVGEVPGNANTAQITLKVAGSGRLRRIS